MRRVVVTGFEPFGEDSENPSACVAAALEGRQLGETRLATRVLPVAHELLAGALRDLLDELRPDVLICTGLASGRPGVALERLAVNVAHYTLPDNGGALLRNGRIAAAGPLAYPSTLPIQEACDRLRAAGIPAELSSSAGTFLCNEVMYPALHAAATAGTPMRAGFVHLPYHSDYIARRERLAPSLPLAMLVHAVALVAETCIAIDGDTFTTEARETQKFHRELEAPRSQGPGSALMPQGRLGTGTLEGPQ